jgi:hypothetical protein
MHRAGRCAAIAAFVVAAAVVAAVPSGASGSPKAGLSIMAAGNNQTVTFVARSSGFSSPVDSYAWTFGDSESTTTSTPTVTHTYASASTFSPAVTETAGAGAVATATGTLRLSDCPVGQSQCTEALHNAGTVQLLQADGPFRIPSCEATIGPAVALSDSGFTGELTVTVSYMTSQPQNVATTCFSSPVAFVDADGQSVHRGALPMCQAAAGPPCVQSIETSGSEVTKILLVPPGDPKVGAP